MAIWGVRLRVITGVILFAFVLTHFLNHSLGIVSLDLMEAGRKPFLFFWRELYLIWVMYAAMSVHVISIFVEIVFKDSFRLAPIEKWRWWLGLFIPLILCAHVYATRYFVMAYDIDDTYTAELATFLLNPHLYVLMGLLMLALWGHSIIGIYQMIKIKSWYSSWSTALVVFTVTIPVLAIAGITGASVEVYGLLQDGDWVKNFVSQFPKEPAALTDETNQFATLFNGSYMLLLLALWGARKARKAVRNKGKVLELTYIGGDKISIPLGTSILDCSRQEGIPHVNVCGGKGRCSTCRVRIDKGIKMLKPPSLHEQAVLQRINAPPNVRLACQTKINTDLIVKPILTQASRQSYWEAGEDAHGAEKEIAVLFADLRGFTKFSERKLPFDVVFVLNHYFELMGAAIEKEDGVIDKFIGDGIMALFGMDDGLKGGCQAAVRAAQGMLKQLDVLNDELKEELVDPLRMGIGIHAGPVIVGNMGYGESTNLTAIGDVTNTASRLEAATKSLDCDLVISEIVAIHAKTDNTYGSAAVRLRGKEEEFKVLTYRAAVTV